MDTLASLHNPDHTGIYKVVAGTISKAKLRLELAKKQRLYAQMLKDGITSKKLLEQTSEEINDINAKIYVHDTKRSG